MKKFLQYIPFLLILLTASLLFIQVNRNEQHAADSLIEDNMVGKDVAVQELERIFSATGNTGNVTLNDYQGEYTMINFFASWCTACLQEHKLIKQFKEINKVRIMGISWRDKKEDSLSWLERNGNPYEEVGLDVQGKFGILMGITGIPETFLIGKDGKILKHVRGMVSNDDLEDIAKIVR